jgi:hypothetical protein
MCGKLSELMVRYPLSCTITTLPVVGGAIDGVDKRNAARVASIAIVWFGLKSI